LVVEALAHQNHHAMLEYSIMYLIII